jgi:hypothetical protein
VADRLSEVASRLYEVTPEEFIAARTEAAEAAKKAGDPKLATAIGKLRKPTVGAWMVNLLAHRRPDLIDELLDLAEALRQAQRSLRGDELRELSLQRRQTVSSLAREAIGLAVASGRRREGLPVADIESTLTAALADAEVGGIVRTGQLARTVEYAGFGEVPRPQLRLVVGGPEKPAKPLKKESKPRDDEESQRTAEKRRREAERAAAEKAAARQVAAERRRRQAEAHRELLAARTQLAEAEAARAVAERAVLTARRRVEAAMAAIEANQSAG